MLITDMNVAEDWRWAPHFHPREFLCVHCGVLQISSGFMDRLFAIRAALGKPMPVTSGYRCSEHNQAVSSTGPTGPHTTGHAADIKASGPTAVHLLSLAQSAMTGIGLKQHGSHESRFIHLDDLNGSTRPWVWTYA